ncbi:MAG TPA: BadF/BadG/BcrA/BcrD ATPase family protein [Streptosporangiaceae bacterium]
MSSADRPLYGIDAGGSGTSVRTWTGERWSMPPVNPSSVGQDASDRCLADLFGRIRAHAESGRERADWVRASRVHAGPDAGPGVERAGPDARPAIWLASASVDPATAGEETRRCAAAARAAGLRAELVISNDITPLLLGAPPEVGHVVVVCGTGTGFLATDGRSAPVRVGGCEYLGSDEGSAFDLGLRGLRTAVRGLDGRGQRTAISDFLAAQAGEPVPELARRLARTPFPKSVVAALAPVVLRAWLAGDQAAAELVDDVIGELVIGARAARDAAAVAAGWRLSVVGGVMTGCPEFFSRLAAAATGLGADLVTLISDPAAALLTALARLAGTDPIGLSDPRIDRDTWYLDLAGDPAGSRGKGLTSGHA